MNFKRNLITILVVVNLLLLFFLVFRNREKFNNQRAAYVNPADKNKIQVDSSVLLDSGAKEKVKKNADLFIDGNLTLGANSLGQIPTLCFGDKCYSMDNLKDFLRFNIPYEVYDTDPIKRETADKLCYDIGEKANCITGSDLKLINGQQYVYLGGPKYDPAMGSRPLWNKDEFHIRHNKGPAPHYYYDINANYYDGGGYDGSVRNQQRKKDKQYIGKFTHERDSDWNAIYNGTGYSGYGNTGLNKVPYFFNLNKLNDGPDHYESVKVDKTRTNYQCGYGHPLPHLNLDHRCGDGILQMVKQPVHVRPGFNYDSPGVHAHNGNRGQTNQIMNLAAVNLLPKDFNGTATDPDKGTVDVRDTIKYKLVPGDKTGLKCY